MRPAACAGIPLPTTLGLHWIARASCELLPANLGEAVRVGLVRRHPVGADAGGWRITGGIAGYKAIDAVLASAAVLTIAVASPLPGPAGQLRWTAIGAMVVIVGRRDRLAPGRRRLDRAPAARPPARRRLAHGRGRRRAPRHRRRPHRRPSSARSR